MIQQKIDELMDAIEKLQEELAAASAQVQALQAVLDNSPERDGVVRVSFGSGNSDMWVEIPYLGDVVEIEEKSLYVINGYVVDMNKAKGIEVIPDEVEEEPEEEPVEETVV